MHHETQVTDTDIYHSMSSTGALNPDIIWLVLQHAAYSDDLWDYRTLRACCRVSHEWYPLAKRMLFRFIVLRSRQQVRILQQTRGKHLQIGPNTHSKKQGYDVFAPEDTWEAQTRILECHWSHEFRFNDIRHTLALFPSLYEVRVRIHTCERPRVDHDDSSIPIPSTIRALRFTGSMIFSEEQNITSASSFISVLSKYTRLHCLQFDRMWITPHLQFPQLFQSIQVNELTYLELEIYDFHHMLSADLFDNLLYLILHQKARRGPWATPQHIIGVFKRVKSLTVFYYSHVTSPQRVPQLSQLSETFPALTELRLGIQLFHLRVSLISPLFSQIPSGLISLSLFISAGIYIRTGLTETQPWDNFTIPPTLRYFEYGLDYSRDAISDPSVIRPFLNACKSMGVQILPFRAHDIIGIVCIPITLLKDYYSLACRLQK